MKKIFFILLVTHFCSTFSQISVSPFLGIYNGTMIQKIGASINYFYNVTTTISALSTNQNFDYHDGITIHHKPFKLNNDSTFCDTTLCACRYGKFYYLDSLYSYSCSTSGNWTKYYGEMISSIDVQDLNFENNYLLIYPNPANQSVFIKLVNSLSYSTNISLINSLGEKLLSTNYVNQIDVSALSEGIYNLQIVTSEAIITKKIVIQH